MRHALSLVLLAAAMARAAEVDLTGVHLAGSARHQDQAVRLTPAERHLAGAAWIDGRQTIGGGFQTEFEFRLSEAGGLGGGADGFAFVLQNSGPAALGGTGSGGGFALGNDGSTGSIPQSIAVFFDTYRNEEIGDPSNNFITICTAGTPQQVAWPPPRLASSKRLSANLKSRKSHTARIDYQPPALTIYLDGKPVLSTAVDLSTVLGADGAAWVGFTASTGDGYENHDILRWTFSPHGNAVSSTISYAKAACLAGRNLCTPEQATVQELEPGLYHVILPGNLEWGAGIPNPSGRPVAILRAHGSVCRDVATRGADGCAGPGELIQRTSNGQTSFGIKGANAANDARANEGYFEFDAQLQ